MMKYTTPPYLSGPTAFASVPFSDQQMVVPKLDYPITPRENFRLAAAHKTPYWIPNDTLDTQLLFSQDLAEGRTQGPDFKRGGEDYTFTDLFHVQWTWVAFAGSREYYEEERRCASAEAQR